MLSYSTLCFLISLGLDSLFGHHTHPRWPKMLCRQAAHKILRRSHSVIVYLYFHRRVRTFKPTFLFKFGNTIQELREIERPWAADTLQLKIIFPFELLSLTATGMISYWSRAILLVSSYLLIIYNCHCVFYYFIYYSCYIKLISRGKTTSGCQWACGGICIAVRVGGIL